MQPYQIALFVLFGALAVLTAAGALLYFRLPKIFTAKTAAAFDNSTLKKTDGLRKVCRASPPHPKHSL